MNNGEIIFLDESSRGAIYDNPVVLAIGVFDGVHAGHRKLIEEARSFAAEIGAYPCIFTFWPYPSHVLSAHKPKEIILHKNEKYDKIFECGIQTIFEQHFDQNFANLSPEDFINLLTTRLNLFGICVGDDFRFGKNHVGDVKMLQSIAKQSGIKVKVVERLKINGNIVSSSLIRENFAKHCEDCVKKSL